jgi:hypothetical protein
MRNRSRHFKGKDSKFEHRLCTTVLKGVPYHQHKIEYTESHVYEVDYGPVIKGNNIIYIEAKGFFMDSKEAAKYKWIRKALEPHEELVFLFMEPELQVAWGSHRKDGSRMTHAEWAERHGFRWFDDVTIKGLLK